MALFVVGKPIISMGFRDFTQGIRQCFANAQLNHSYSYKTMPRYSLSYSLYNPESLKSAKFISIILSEKTNNLIL